MGDGGSQWPAICVCVLTRASSLKLEPFCRGGFGSRSSGPSQCVAVLRTRRDAQRSGQIRPALPKRSLAPPRRVCKRRPPSSSKRLPVAPATGCTLLLLARLAVCKQNCFQLKARRSSQHAPALVPIRKLPFSWPVNSKNWITVKPQSAIYLCVDDMNRESNGMSSKSNSAMSF